MHRFFVRPSDVDGAHIHLRDADDLHHLRHVLRLGAGDEVDISDGAFWEYRAVIESVTAGEALLRITDKQAFGREPRLQVTLYQGIPKAGKMEDIIRKCVELGVSAIVPVRMARTVAAEAGNFEKKRTRWQRISEEAGKQCRRGRIPPVRQVVTLREILPELATYDLVLFPYENERERSIKACLRQVGGDCRHVAILIGPEGGFADEEAAMLDAAGAVRVSLGRTILRTETAGPAALAMTMYELEL